jgi:hypothetical protein
MSVLGPLYWVLTLIAAQMRSLARQESVCLQRQPVA